MKILVKLSALAVALAAAGTVAAQNADSVGQIPVVASQEAAQATADKAVEQAATAATPVKGVADTLVKRLPGDTHVRIVRLSQAQGKVGMDRGAGHGVEMSMQNMPIAENMALGTSKDDSYAEVELEDGSTLRLGPDTAVAFPQLVLRATGAKATMIRVDRGTVYVSRESTKNDEFALVIGGTKKIDVSPSTHLRLEVTGTKAAIAVFSGNIAVEGPGAPVMAGKKQTLSLDVADSSGEVELAKKVEEGPFDGWDQDAQKYHERYAKANSLLGNGYGVGDLNYYGSFVNVGGGQFWQPYFVGAGWSPYGNGLWALYPGGIYSWVSPYPWGWLPFHSGTWTYIPSFGWGWQPGGTFAGINNMGGGHFPVRGGGPQLPGGLLPRPPLKARESMVAVNQQQLVISRAEAGGKFVFRSDSAGLGVPRGSMGKLGGISNDVAHHGFSNREVYVAPAGSPSRWNDGQVYHGPLAFHRGPMSDEARQAMWARQQAGTGAIQTQHGEGQLAAGSRRGAQTPGQNGVASGWQGRQGQSGQLNTANGLAWKQGGANAAGAGANGSHSWNNAGAGTGAGASGHSWSGSNASAGGASMGGHTWNGAGNAGASAGGSHTWSGGGNAGGGGMNAGGGHSGSGGGAPASTGGSGGSSAGSAGSHK